MAKIYVNDMVKKSSLQLIYCCTCIVHSYTSLYIFVVWAEFGVIQIHVVCIGIGT